MTRVWVMRDEPPDGPLGAALRRHGLEPVPEPVVARRVTSDARAELEALSPGDWLVLTSAYAAGAIAADAVRCRVAAVGPSTAAAARERRLEVGLISPDGTGDGLWAALRTAAVRGRICYPRSALADLPAAWAGVEIIAPVVYQTVAREFDRSVARRVDVAAVTSPSVVPALASLDRAPPCASIGPTTSAALAARQLTAWLQPPEPTFDSLAHAIAQRVSPGPTRP